MPALAAEDATYAQLDERLSLHDDEQAFAETKTALEAARAAHDDRAELLALRDRSLALCHHDEMHRSAASDQASWADIDRRGMTLARSLGDNEALGRFLFFEAVRLHAEQAPASEVVPLLESSTAIARAGHADRLLADDERERGELETELVHGATALEFLNDALARYESLHVAVEVPRVLSAISAVYRMSADATQADLETSASLARRAVARYEMRFGQDNLGQLLMMLGLAEKRLRHDAQAEELWRRVIVIADAEHDPVMGGHARFRLGSSLLDRGVPAQALPELEAATTTLKAGEKQAVLDCMIFIATARAYAQLHRRESALAALASAGAIARDLGLARLDVDYHDAAADVLAGLGDYSRANDELRQLLAADRAAAQANDQRRLQELKVKFEVDVKERDNALLRARAAEADSRRLALSLALALSVLLLGGGATLLILRLRAQRSSNTLLAQLARNGREMTFGLDQSAVTATLRRQLETMARGAVATVWLRGAAGLERADGPAPPHDDSTTSDADCMVVRCASTAQEIVDPELSRLRRAWWAPLRRRRSGELRLFEPLLDGEQVIGVVQIDFADARCYRGRERQIVRTTCLYAAVALANIRTAQLLSESQVELEQERTRDMLVHTARLVTVGSMASGIVHEMSHPVGAMMLQSSNAQASLEIGESDEANEALSGIHREARRLQSLITRLRNLCRADPPQVEDMALLEVLDDARALFQPQLHMARVEFVQEASSVRVKVDAERVVLAIANIVFNAMDAMEGRDVRRIEVRLTARDGFARLHIRDTGPGLSPTQLARLFEPFYTTKPSGKGLGLGLALSAKSVASMNGRIEAANHPDGGAVFTICLPLATGSDADCAHESLTGLASS